MLIENMTSEEMFDAAFSKRIEENYAPRVAQLPYDVAEQKAVFERQKNALRAKALADNKSIEKRAMLTKMARELSIDDVLTIVVTTLCDRSDLGSKAVILLTRLTAKLTKTALDRDMSRRDADV